MQKEILLVAQSVSGEKDLPEETIFEAIELALATATKKRYQGLSNIEVNIDRSSGEFETFRCWEVVEEEDYEDPGIHKTLEEVITQDKKLKIGSLIREKVENVEFGRIAAQAAKQVIVQKVREAERAKIVDYYKPYLGELISGTVKKVTREFLIMDLGDGAEAILPKTELVPGEIYRIGDRIRGVLKEEERENRGSQLVISRKCPEMVGELFKLEVPEIAEDVIEIKAIARDSGSRTKIAVKTNDNRIDPVGACVGMRGSRVQAVSSELGNERLDIVIWDDDPAKLLINAMGQVEITSIVLDEDEQTMEVVVSEDTLAQSIGKNGQNVRLCSQITGWKLKILNEEETGNEVTGESISTSNLQKYLDVDSELATLLVQEGFTDLEKISSSTHEDLMKVEGLDQEMSSVIIERSKDALLSLAIEMTSESEEASHELMSLDNMNMTLALELNQKGIKNREDLAEQSVDELRELVNIDEEIAGKLIMEARKHWFD